jgi:hypothetical protein
MPHSVENNRERDDQGEERDRSEMIPHSADTDETAAI